MSAGPSCHVILPAPYDRAVWLALRNHGIGGSDAAAVLGFNPWKSGYALWLEKRGEITPDQAEPGPDSPMYWGTALEDDIAAAFELTTGLQARTAPGLLASNDRPWQFANPDRLVYDGNELIGLLECKTTGLQYGRDWDGEDLPVPALLQTQHYLAVTGLPRAWCAGLIAGQRFVVKDVTSDPSLQAAMIRDEQRFWDLVQVGEPPPPDGSTSSADAIRTRWPEATDPDGIVLSPADYDDVTRIRELGKAIKDLTRERDALSQGIQHKLGEHPAGYYDDEIAVRWSNVTTNRIDTTALKADRPDVAAEYTKASTYRRFTVVGGKD